MKVYGLENKDGYFYNFVNTTFTIWSHQCALPAEQLAEDILLIHAESAAFYGVRVVPVTVSD